MEWIEVTAGTVEEAKQMALSELGVKEADAEFEVLSEEKTGLFGRLKSEARVRARIKPRSPRTQQRRKTRGGSGSRKNDNSRNDSGGQGQRSSNQGQRSGGGGRGGQNGRDSRNDRDGNDSNDNNNRNGRDNRRPSRGPREGEVQLTMDEIQDVLEPFLQGLVDALGKTAEIKFEQSEDMLEIRVVGDDLGALIGPRGSVLSSLYDVLSTVIHRHFKGDRYPHIRLDVGDYRKKRREALVDFTKKLCQEAIDTQKEIALEPMKAEDRKLIHGTAAEIDGISTQSEGEAPNRRVVLIPVQVEAQSDQGDQSEQADQGDQAEPSEQDESSLEDAEVNEE